MSPPKLKPVLPRNVYTCKCGQGTLDPKQALAHIQGCDGPLVVHAEGTEATFVAPKGPGETQVLEGAVLHMDGRTGTIGFPEHSN